MSSPTSIADPKAPTAVTAVTDLNDAGIDKENKNAAVNNNQKITPTSLLDASKGGTCASFYIKEGNSRKVLMAMAYGIKSGDRNIGDCDLEPYASATGKTHFVPVMQHLINEIHRRCVSQKIKPVKCKNYSKTILHKWLMENPIDDPEDVTFLVKEEAKLRKAFTEGQQEKEKNLLTTKESNKTNVKPWNSNDPYLRLYHCLCVDEVKEAFLRKDDAHTRQQLDGSKSSKRSLNWTELARDRFNDPAFIPISLELADWHQDFAQPFPLELHHMPDVITEHQVKWRLADCRAKLILVSQLSISRAWYIYLVYMSNFFYYNNGRS
jgi:hypothetical protein